MILEILAAGTNPPAWIQEGVSVYQKRMPKECRLEIKDIANAKRVKNDSISNFKQREEQSIRRQLVKGAHVVAMDSRGKMWSTEDLGEKLSGWMGEYRHVQFLIGGPDGLSEGSLSVAQETWSLSRLTFPHFMVRLLMAEQLYRAWSLINNHPYHK